MAFQEAFKATPEGAALNETAFTEGGKLGTALSSKVDEVKAQLNKMGEAMGENLDDGKLAAASEAVKQELNESVPDNLRAEYETAENDAEAAKLVQERILANLDSFITQKLEGIV